MGHRPSTTAASRASELIRNVRRRHRRLIASDISIEMYASSLSVSRMGRDALISPPRGARCDETIAGAPRDHRRRHAVWRSARRLPADQAGVMPASRRGQPTTSRSTQDHAQRNASRIDAGVAVRFRVASHPRLGRRTRFGRSQATCRFSWAAELYTTHGAQRTIVFGARIRPVRERIWNILTLRRKAARRTRGVAYSGRTTGHAPARDSGRARPTDR
jgi:hypothetical protein